MKVGILGGAFDPPTIGHTSIASFMTKILDEVWIMPCYQSAFGKKMTSNEHRIKMCELAVQNIENVKASSFEIDHQITGGTIYCVEKLKKEFPQHEFFWIIGQDNANVFHLWHRSEELKKMIPFIVVPRRGYVDSEKTSWYKEAPHVYLPEIELPEISSTAVRNWILEKNNIEILMINTEVLRYVEHFGIYQREKS